MAIKGIVTTILLCISFVLNAQQELNFQTVNTKTYEYYQHQHWDSLILLGNKAINEKIDFFYLRVRLGYAYYIKGNYTKAIDHFVAANQFNSYDPFVLECLYYAYIFSNQPTEANYLLKSNKNSFNQNTIKDNIVRLIYAETSVSTPFHSENPILRKQQSAQGPHNLKWLDANKILSSKYTAIGTQLYLNKYLITTLSYAYLLLDNSKDIWINNNLLNDRYYLYQHQLYVNSTIRLKKNHYLTAAINGINVNFNSLHSDFVPPEQKVLLWREETNLFNFAASCSFKQRNKNTEWSVNAGFSNFNNSTQKSTGINLVFYPKGNLNLYLTTSASLLLADKEKNIVVNGNLGFKVMKYLWMEPFVGIGKISNYAENNAYVIYNTSDISNLRIGSSIIAPINKFKLSARYMFQQKSSPFEYFDNRFRTGFTNYPEHQLFVNLSWWF